MGATRNEPSQERRSRGGRRERSAAAATKPSTIDLIFHDGSDDTEACWVLWRLTLDAAGAAFPAAEPVARTRTLEELRSRVRPGLRGWGPMLFTDYTRPRRPAMRWPAAYLELCARAQLMDGYA